MRHSLSDSVFKHLSYSQQIYNSYYAAYLSRQISNIPPSWSPRGLEAPQLHPSLDIHARVIKGLGR